MIEYWLKKIGKTTSCNPIGIGMSYNKLILRMEQKLRSIRTFPC